MEKYEYNTECRSYCELDGVPYCKIKMDMCFCGKHCAFAKERKGRGYPVKVTDEMRKAMQADFDKGMSHATIAKRYGVSERTVERQVEVRYTESSIIEKRFSEVPDDFEEQWNAARFRVLGIRPEWIDEWDEARQKLLKGAQVWATEK